LGTLDANGELTNVTGLVNGSYITVAIFLEAPGGITSDLALWLKADVGTDSTIEGNPVSSWLDQSLAGNEFTAAADDEAVIATGAANFNTGLTFDTDDFLSFSGQIYNADESHQIYMVTNAVTGNIAWSQLANGGTGKILNIGGTYQNNNTGSTPVNGAGTSAVLRINTVEQNGLNITTFGNGATSNDGAHNGGTETIISSNIGGQDFGGHEIQGEIMEFIVYTDSNSSPNRQKIESYLALKYGITLDAIVGDYVNSAGESVFQLGFSQTATGAEATDNTGGNGNPDGGTLGGTITIPAAGTYTVIHTATINANGAGSGFGINTTPFTNGENAAALTSEIVGANVFSSSSDRINATTPSKTYTVNFPAAGTYYIGFFSGGTNSTSGHTLTVTDGNNTYSFDVFGIANETVQALNQDISKSVNTGAIVTLNLQFDGYDNNWVLLTRTTDDDFSATSGTTENALSADGIVAVNLTGTSYFTLAQKPIAIEFETATANDVEAAGGNLPNLLIEGTLTSNATIDVVVNASGTATAGTDYNFGSASGDDAVTISGVIPAGTYSASNPLPLATTLVDDIALNVSYTNLSNPPANFEQTTFVPAKSGDYVLRHSVETVNSGNGWVNVGTTASGGAGSSDIYDGVNGGERVDAANLVRTRTISLTAGTTYYLTTGAGVNSNLDGVTIFITLPIALSITDDDLVEADETISFSLSNPNNGLKIENVLGAELIDTHVYTITNDDTATVTIAADTDAPETTANRAFTLTMDRAAATDVEVSYQLSGTAGRK